MANGIATEKAGSEAPVGTMGGLIAAVRPKEWIKNTFVFAAILFSGKVFEREAVLAALQGFAALCMAASATYLLNDVRDREADRQHPTKRNRPIAAGVISPAMALGTSAILAALALLLAFTVNRETGLVLLGYLTLTTLYSSILKHMVILDVLAIACGFVFRVILGAEAIRVEFSSWLVLCTFMLAVFLGFGKRRNEMMLLEGQASSHRPILGEYSLQFLDKMMGVVTACTVMSYVLYTMDPHTVERFGSRNLIYSSVIVLYGIFRYLYLVHQKAGGGNPANIVLSDRPIQVAVALWVVVVFLLRYF